jgi:ribonuclease R
MSLPDPQAVADYVRSYRKREGEPPARRDVTKAFGLKGADRADMRQLLTDMQKEGLIELEGKSPRGARKAAKPKGPLPKVAVMDVTGTDAEGDLLAAPLKWEGEPPRVVLPDSAARRTKPPLGVGDRFLGRLLPRGDGFEAEPIKRLDRNRDRVLGVFASHKQGGVVEPVSRKAGDPLLVPPGDEGGAKDGDLVWAEPQEGRGYERRARVAEVVGGFADSRNWSLIALANQDIPVDFPRAAIAEAEETVMPDGEHHEDLRDTPLVTIDPSDAKDHDDAVYAEADGDGWRVLVAIADVSWFVRPGSALDEEARRRGNSVYLVDRVVPMLPEALSNGLCSLHEEEDRPALVCEMRIGPDGQKRSHRFFRALMRSRASLSYEEAQAGADNEPNARTRPLVRPVITPLWGAYRALMKARAGRSPLDLDLPERKIVLGADGAVEEVVLKERFDAHKLIEAMMVAANVCAAESLEEARRTCVYRVHEAPDPERLDALRQYLETLGYSLPKGQVETPQMFNRVLEKAEERDEVAMVSMAVLRTQAQARYDTTNLGHFGLNLGRYAHFTSPIRRYADLTVHRALVAALRLGPGGERGEDKKSLADVAEAISDTERRAVAAERETQDRFLAAFLERQVGAEFAARVNGTNKAGLFVTLDETGADGFVPARTLGAEFFEHDEKANALVGRVTGGRYHLGQKVRVRLLEATPVQGGLRFEMLTEPVPGERPGRGGRRGKGQNGARPGGAAKPKGEGGARPEGKARARTARPAEPARRRGKDQPAAAAEPSPKPKDRTRTKKGEALASPALERRPRKAAKKGGPSGKPAKKAGPPRKGR